MMRGSFVNGSCIGTWHFSHSLMAFPKLITRVEKKADLWARVWALIFHFLPTSVVVISDPREKRGCCRGGLGGTTVLVFSMAPSLERGSMEAKHQPGCDRHPQMNLSRGVFENVYYTGVVGSVGEFNE